MYVFIVFTQVVFVGIRGENVFSDIAIDYVIIRPQSCDYSPPCTYVHVFLQSLALHSVSRLIHEHAEQQVKELHDHNHN